MKRWHAWLLLLVAAVARVGVVRTDEMNPPPPSIPRCQMTHQGVFCVAFSPDGKTLASGSDDATIKLWDATTGKEQAALQGHTSWVNSVAFSPDGKTLASGSSDKTIRLWEVTTGK